MRGVEVKTVPWEAEHLTTQKSPSMHEANQRRGTKSRKRNVGEVLAFLRCTEIIPFKFLLRFLQCLLSFGFSAPNFDFFLFSFVFVCGSSRQKFSRLLSLSYSHCPLSQLLCLGQKTDEKQFVNAFEE
jgi:hypothetical protein